MKKLLFLLCVTSVFAGEVILPEGEHEPTLTEIRMAQEKQAQKDDEEKETTKDTEMYAFDRGRDIDWDN